MNNRYLAIISLAVTTLLSTPLYAADLDVSDAWVAEAPPMAAVMAGYMTLHNKGKTGIKIFNVSSPEFKSAEIHEMTTDANGMMSMSPIPHLEIKAGKSVTLAPGGYHLMLYGPKTRYKQGDKIAFKFVLSDNTSMEVKAQVRKKVGHAMDHGHMDHEHMQHGDMPMHEGHEQMDHSMHNN